MGSGNTEAGSNRKGPGSLTGNKIWEANSEFSHKPLNLKYINKKNGRVYFNKIIFMS